MTTHAHILAADLLLYNNMSSKSSKLGKKTHKIILLGDSEVGKTCIIQKFASNRFDQFYNPTIGVDFVSKDIKYKGAVCRLQLWDTAGEQKFKILVPSYLKDAVCSKPSSLANLQKWITLFRDNKKERAISLICGNKNDLDKNFQKQRLQKLIQKYKMPYYCVSAKNGNNVEQLFYKIAQMLQREEKQRVKKVKGSYSEEYQMPPTTVDSITRSQTKQSTLEVKEQDQEKKFIEKKGLGWCDCLKAFWK